jgi:hypothetical protein
MLRKLTSTLSILFILGLLPTVANAGVPDWLRTLAQQPVKTYADDVNAVILLQEHVTTVKENGDIVQHGRIAVRICRQEGRVWANYPVFYDSDSKVDYLRGWSITNKGQEYETKDLLEQSVSSYEVYSDTRAKIVRVPGADVGTVVGFEYERKARPYIHQDFWNFQGEEPVEQSRYELHLAAGWRFKADWINYETQKPTEQNGSIIWTLGGIPRIEHEPLRPTEGALAGRLVITFLSDSMHGKSYRDWNEFGSWLSSGVRNTNPALQQKTQELAPTNVPMLQRIKSLARFAQSDVRYVEISIGVGGWRPHLAGDIFTHRYGDCKDKATILSSMLSQIGIKSYYVLVDTDRGVITEKSPPQAHFNHMILAISMPPGSYSGMPAIYQHSKLGALLIFDPTNELVPFGQIPSYEQDSYALLVNEEGGDLIHLPLSVPESNKVTRNAKLTLMPDGSIQGEIEEVRSGFEAMRGRGLLRHETEANRKKSIESVLGRNMGNFQLTSLEVVDLDDIEKDLTIRYKFSANHYAKTAGPLLLVRPRVVGEMAGAFDVTKPRHYAYDFDAPFLRSDTVEITLPEGYSVDELPEPAKAIFPFAEYTSKAEKDGNVLKYSRQYRMQTTQVPLGSIEQLRKLFAQIGMDEKNLAVLKKGN